MMSESCFGDHGCKIHSCSQVPNSPTHKLPAICQMAGEVSAKMPEQNMFLLHETFCCKQSLLVPENLLAKIWRIPPPPGHWMAQKRKTTKLHNIFYVCVSFCLLEQMESKRSLNRLTKTQLPTKTKQTYFAAPFQLPRFKIQKVLFQKVSLTTDLSVSARIRQLIRWHHHKNKSLKASALSLGLQA